MVILSGRVVERRPPRGGKWQAAFRIYPHLTVVAR
jgi:hypothetical protein